MLFMKLSITVFVAVLICFQSLVAAYPNIRVKRSGIVDQHIAHLEARARINRINRLKSQVGYGVVDHVAIGRRKRFANNIEETIRRRESFPTLHHLMNSEFTNGVTSKHSSSQSRRQTLINKLLDTSDWIKR